MSIIKYLKIRSLFRKIHNILDSWKGWNFNNSKEYEIDKMPLPPELKKGMDKPAINLIGNKNYIIFYYTKPSWTIFIGLMVDSSLNFYWVESSNDKFFKSSKLDEPPIPTDIKENFINLILENKSYYIETVGDWLNKAKKEYFANYGR